MKLFLHYKSGQDVLLTGYMMSEKEELKISHMIMTEKAYEALKTSIKPTYIVVENQQN